MQDTFPTESFSLNTEHLGDVVEGLLALKWMLEQTDMSWTGGSAMDILKFHAKLEEDLISFQQKPASDILDDLYRHVV